MTDEELKELELKYLEGTELDLASYKGLYIKGIELIRSERQPKKLLIEILDEYQNRLENMPAVDLTETGLQNLDRETKDKVRSLILFGTQAVLIKENSDMQKKLYNSNMNYRDLLNVVTHEFKNSLTSINGYNRLIQKRLLNKKYEELQEISDSVDRLTRNLFGLVETLFSMSLIEEGQLRLDYKIFDFINDVLKPVQAELKFRLQKKQMTVNINAAEKINIFYGDEKFFQLIFRNLILNAIQYGRPDSEIDINLNRKNDLYEIIIFNQGSGLEVENLDKVFDKFSRFHKTNNKANIGIGLYAVKNIVELHKGTITAESEFTKWMRFKITVPVESKTA